jgi:hypothetical protein
VRAWQSLKRVAPLIDSDDRSPPLQTPPAVPAALPYEPADNPHDHDGNRDLYPERSAKNPKRNFDSISPRIWKRIRESFNNRCRGA